MPYWRLYYHFVWATRNRDPLIDEPVEALIRESLAESAEALSARIHAVGMVADHSHLLVSMPPKVAPADAISRFKGASSHAVRGALPTVAFRWQAEYGVLSFSKHGLGALTEYVQNQRERHARGDLLAPLERIPEP
jgi:putative transposase